MIFDFISSAELSLGITLSDSPTSVEQICHNFFPVMISIYSIFPVE